MSPCVGLWPTKPHSDAGTGIDPPWPPPRASSPSPAATSAALPLDDPPVSRVVSHGLRTGPEAEVKLDPDAHRSSHTVLAEIVAPAASNRSTTVASRLGTKPSTARDPFIIGMPATAMLSLIATARPVSGPSAPEAISVVTYQAPSGLSPGSGNR